MKTYKIYTLGCKVNQYDSGKLAGGLESAGFKIAPKNADLAIINSCAVTQTAMNKSARIVKVAKKENPKAKIILVGCWTRVARPVVDGVDLVLKSSDVNELIKKIAKKTPLDNGLSAVNRSRYFMKIQDGCEQYCSYCIIPYARGKIKSRSEREVIREIKLAAAAGFEEIVLSGIHLGLYGKGTKNNLASLLKKLVKIKNLGRIRLSSIEITEVNDEIIKLIKSGKVCRHLHIPLQSGCDKILKLMNRPYDTKYFSDRIKQIRKQVPDIAVSTDVIVGFPGETEKDFQITKKFIEKIKFSRLHVFPFSAHEKTPAAKFFGQVVEKERLRRAKELRQLGFKLEKEYRKKFKGKNLEVVVERIGSEKILGKTEYYFDVEIAKNKFSDAKVGQIIKIKN